MAKFQSPLLGYNNNVRHKNRQFHIQTEDSGVNHPHIITHLFMDGGRILKSVKTSYAEHVGADGMSEIVRGLMKEQHKAMFIALRDGQFDPLVDPGAAAAAPAAAAAATATAAAATASAAAADLAAAVTEAAAPSIAPKTNPEAPAVAIVEAAGIELPVELPPNTIDETQRSVDPSPPSSAPPKALPVEAPRLLIAEPDPEDVPMTTRQPAETRPDMAAASLAANASASASANANASANASAKRSPSGRELTLDFDALEHAGQGAVSASLFHASDLPPPPKNLFAAKEPGSGGVYRAIEADPRHDSREEAGGRSDWREETGSRPGVRRGPVNHEARAPDSRAGAGGPPPSTRSPQPGRTAPRSAPVSRPAEARYAPARPAAIFGSTQRPPPQSLFSDELVSDKSLDEVILSYLAEDLEPPRRK